MSTTPFDHLEPPPSFQQAAGAASIASSAISHTQRTERTHGLDADALQIRRPQRDTPPATKTSMSAPHPSPRARGSPIPSRPTSQSHPISQSQSQSQSHSTPPSTRIPDHQHQHDADRPAQSTALTSDRPRSNPTSTTLHAAPASRAVFDPWSTSSTGHQRAENHLSGSTSWRDSRNLKLGAQYRGGRGGGLRVADTVGAGSEAFGRDGRTQNGGWTRGAPGLRRDGQRSLMDVWGAGKGTKRGAGKGLQAASEGEDRFRDAHLDVDVRSRIQEEKGEEEEEGGGGKGTSTAPKPIFANLTFYLNGSTAPLISDHKLKHLVAAHGGQWSIALARRTVTHVILGAASSRGGGGCGGGLAAGKLQKEIARVGGKGVKFVGADWVLQSIEAGKRVPEARFEGLKMAPKGQGSVYAMFAGGGGGGGSG